VKKNVLLGAVVALTTKRASVSGWVRQRCHRRHDLERGRVFREDAKPMTARKD